MDLNRIIGNFSRQNHRIKDTLNEWKKSRCFKIFIMSNYKDFESNDSTVNTMWKIVGAISLGLSIEKKGKSVRLIA